MAENKSYIDYPTPQATEVAYKSPPPNSNPVVGGLALHYGASLISASSFIQGFLWSNAGFNGLRGRGELDSFPPRYDPTVIPPNDDLIGENIHNFASPSETRVPPKDAKGRFYTVEDYHNAYKSGKLTPTSVVESLFPLIRRDVEKATSHSTAFINTNIELVKKAAEESTARYKEGRPLGLLDGVPVAVKDEVDVKGYKRCVGTKLDLSTPGGATTWCVAKWEEQGAIVIGKSNMHEIGLDTTNNNPNYGTPLNPHNEHYYTGGSSGGSGYVVGAGIAPIALGADGGGSIRIPSSFCGVFGLKPSHNRVSGRPTPSLALTTGVLGPIASNMVDLEIAYRVMAAKDPQNPKQSLFPTPARQKAANRRKVLGIYKTWFDRADKPVREVCQKAVDFFTSKLGYEVVDITIPLIHEGQVAHAMTILCEIGAAWPDVSQLTGANKVLVKVGSKTPALDFMLAQRLRNLLMQHLSHLFKKHPGLIIVTPTTPIPGWHIKGGPGDLKYGVSDGNMSIRNMEYVWISNFTGTPSLSFPAGYVDPAQGDGRIPVGLMGMSDWGTEDALIEWGYDGEQYLNEGLEGGRLRPKSWVDVLSL